MINKTLTSLAVLAGALAVASGAAAKVKIPGYNGVLPYGLSDALVVLDGNGNLVDYALESEVGEDPNNVIQLFDIPINPDEFGDATVLLDPDGTVSDIFGIYSNGTSLTLSFASDSETQGPDFGSFPRTYDERRGDLGVPGAFDATRYLSLDAQDSGWRAFFISDSVPEPAAWGMMLAGFGLGGAMLRRRRAITA